MSQPAVSQEMLAKGTLWTKEMEMRLTDNDIVLLDGETQDVIEVYPLSSISVVQHINEDSDLNSVLLFTTQQTDEKYAATHLFQSDRVPAAVVATEIMKASSSKGAMPSRSTPNKGGASLPPPPAYTAPQPPTLAMPSRSTPNKGGASLPPPPAYTAPQPPTL
ncbi:Epidermal growth factor receptor kinase substrate 8, partial [Exaiptasia diaphana]